MKTFKDNMNDEWTIHLTLTKARQIREKIGVDALHPEHHMRLLDSLTERLTFVYLLCEGQAKERNVGIDEFEESMASVTNDVSDAFLEELSNFYRRFDQPAMAKLTDAARETMQTARTQVSAMLENGEIDSVFRQIQNSMVMPLPETDGTGSPSSKSSPASTADNSPSESSPTE